MTQTNSLVSGFTRLACDADDATNEQDHIASLWLHWFCEPKSADGSGSWRLSDDKKSLTIVPAAKKDFWRKTYYQPTILKDDGAILFAKLPWTTSTASLPSSQDNHRQYTVETKFVLRAVRQFDQAGIMIRLSHEHWLKTGIEVVDGHPRLSCVVTNIYSDWSTQPWSEYHTEQPETGSDGAASLVVARCHIRVHLRGESVVVEAKTTDGAWEFMRIAHLSTRTTSVNESLPASISNSASHGPEPADNEVWAGIFACSPEDQQGGSATFSMLEITEGSDFHHNADGNLE